MVMTRAICASDLWKSLAMAVRQKVTKKKSNESSNHPENPATTAGRWPPATSPFSMLSRTPPLRPGNRGNA